ncbi:hypothetical protein PG996_015481 [Apiospora saccharicola]|uniref:Uncharacterized protein n=1 Tax=Apiospora saccharicola TaxID=335842 RepID=A0ABR1TLC3_9PEZI
MSDFLGSGGYKAGLWAPSLRRHLTWRVDTLPPGLRRPRYRGPSWSWVSVDAKVRFWDEEDMRPPAGASAVRPRERRVRAGGKKGKDWE